MDKQAIKEKAFKYYGPDKQLIKLQEECGELVAAISRYMNNPTTVGFLNVIEETVDVKIVSEQFFENHYNHEMVKGFEDMKLERLEGRINDAER